MLHYNFIRLNIEFLSLLKTGLVYAKAHDQFTRILVFVMRNRDNGELSSDWLV